jgi:NAD(P)H-hydrate epimerase
MLQIKKLPVLHSRNLSAHKGDFGKVLIVAGSCGMTGAAYLAAKGALRAGAGLAVVATPESQQPILAGKLTCAMTYPLPETPEQTISLKALRPILELAKKSDVIAIGPGISRNPSTMSLVLALLKQLTIPVVLDADAIIAISKKPNILKEVSCPIIITPHQGEMFSLIGKKITPLNRLSIAKEFTARYNITLVLKGFKSLVMNKNKFYVNTTGNPGMATGGTGDVLTGIISGLLAQGLSPFDASVLGVFIHGKAGDIGVKDLGEISFIASDILSYLPNAFKSLQNQK